MIFQLCTDINLKLIFTSVLKSKTFFPFKDPIRQHLKSLVVYQFTCAGCSSRYIGETTRHLTTRIREHKTTDKKSHIYKHLFNSSHCETHYTPSTFKIIDSAQSPFALKIN